MARLPVPLLCLVGFQCRRRAPLQVLLGKGSVVAAAPLEVWLGVKWLLGMVFVGVGSPLEIWQQEVGRALCAALLCLVRYQAPLVMVWLQWGNFELKTNVGFILGLFGFSSVVLTVPIPIRLQLVFDNVDQAFELV